MSDSSATSSIWRVLTATPSVPGPLGAGPRLDGPAGVDTLEPQAPERFCRHQGMVPGGPCADSELESEVLAGSRQGISILSAVLVVTLVLVFVSRAVFHDVLGWSEAVAGPWTLLRQVGLLALSALMFVATRHPALCPRTINCLGHAYQLLGALLISVSVFGPGQVAPSPDLLTWLGVWIVLFPLVAPGKARTSAALALASALTVPAVLLVSRLVQGLPLAPGLLVQATTPYLVCVGLAVVPAVLIQRLSRGFSRANDRLQALGTYRLLEPLGQGGMGQVWRAEHVLLRRPAAIKVIRPGKLEGSTPAERENVVARFEREATTTASLRSPHTIDLYDFGHTEDGSFYYVMELIEGLDLDELVREHGPLPPARAVHLLAQVCASLAEAHARGIVHRDLKPANVMLCWMGLQADFVKVLDFGLVRAATGDGDVRLTGEDAIVGTPAYMSPEQAQGREVDARSDVYSLGCLGYWLLTGRLVFEQDKALPMILDHMNRQPERPSARLGRALPPALEGLILECLAKDPAGRPASALALRARLLALDLGGEEAWSDALAAAWWEEHHPQVAVARPTLDPALDPTRAPTLQLAHQG
ncbi:MAG: serine/threonine-protein kinase [Planctomycetota bacterium]